VTANTEQRKLAAIMFTDMVGYSALSQRDDKLALELLEEHRQLLREIFRRFNGIEIKTIGDAFLIEFQSALEAAQCAIEIQRTLAKRNHDVSPERRIELKIGIHIGDVVHRGGDVYGDGVNIASRIERLAGAGGICVSMDVERQIRNALEARFEKLAPTELKNISVAMDLFRIVLPWEHRVPSVAKSVAESKSYSRKFASAAIALVLLLIIGVGWWWTTQPRRSPPSSAASSTAHSADQKSIAVLPFENLSRDPDNAYFAEGMQDEILARLSKIADLKVISRTSTQKYKSAPDNLREIAKQLGVANILEGSVQKAADQVRVNVQLINALNDAHLWADIYDRKLTDIFAVESDIAKTIADTLQAKLTGSEKRTIAAQPTENSEAHEFYLKGRFFWNKRTGNDLKKSIDYFNQAIAKDAGYALAYAGLADAYALLSVYGAAPPGDAFPKAKVAAQKALELDNTLAEAHTSLGFSLTSYDFDFTRAIAEFKRAIELNPNYATAHHWYGNSALMVLGRFDEAIAEIKRSVELDPLSIINNADLGETYYMAHRYDEAIDQLRKTVEIEPGFYFAHSDLGAALQVKGDLAGAIAEYQKARELNDDPFPLGQLGNAYAASGRKAEALKILDQLEQISKQRYVAAYSFALVHIGLGHKDAALRWLEKSYQDRAGYDVIRIPHDPLLDALRGDPHFEALVQKVVAPKTQQ
jgi:TolB-like protein/class 3 adenylate cyclase/Flp pilus assembly protein TadD